MMSEKRFEVIDNSFSMWIVDTTLKEDRHEGNIYTAYEMCDKLNELCEENERLKKELSECEKFRYSVFKRMEKTIENKKNCAINKDAKYPCKAYDECLKRKGTNKPLPCMVNWMMGRTFENMLRKEGDDE